MIRIREETRKHDCKEKYKQTLLSRRGGRQKDEGKKPLGEALEKGKTKTKIGKKE